LKENENVVGMSLVAVVDCHYDDHEGCDEEHAGKYDKIHFVFNIITEPEACISFRHVIEAHNIKIGTAQ
jgi:hypothetical protein